MSKNTNEAHLLRCRKKFGLLIFFIMLFSIMLSVNAGAGDICALLNGNTLALPCLGAGGNYYSASLSLVQSSALRFRIDTVEPSSLTANCADFNGSTMLMHMPCVAFQGTNYQADLKLITLNPLVLELSGMGLQDSDSKILLVTEQDSAYSIDKQKEIAKKIRNLNAAMKKSIVAVNELLYTDFKKTSYEDFKKRVAAADKALAMEDTAATALKSVPAAKTAVAMGRISVDGAKRAAGEVAGGTVSLGVSAKADEISAQLNKIADIMSPEAKRKQSELNKEVGSVYAEHYANEATMSDVLLKASVAVDAGAKVGAFVGGASLAVPGMAAASIGAFIPAYGALFVNGISTLIGVADDMVIFSGGNGPVPSEAVPMLSKINTAFGVLTLKADSAAETGLNILNTFGGLFADKVNEKIQFDPSGNMAPVTTNSCTANKHLQSGATAKIAGASCPNISSSLQLNAGSYRDPYTGAEIVSPGLDSEWDETIRSFSDQAQSTETVTECDGMTVTWNVSGIDNLKSYPEASRDCDVAYQGQAPIGSSISVSFEIPIEYGYDYDAWVEQTQYVNGGMVNVNIVKQQGYCRGDNPQPVCSTPGELQLSATYNNASAFSPDSPKRGVIAFVVFRTSSSGTTSSAITIYADDVVNQQNAVHVKKVH